MSHPTTKPPTYLDRLLTDLDDIHAGYNDILSASAIINIDPNRNASSGMVFLGSATWGWAKSDAALEASRMMLLRHIRDWEPRFRLLFSHPHRQRTPG